MVDFEFIIHHSEPKAVHTDIELFYVLEGTARFTLEDKQYLLRPEDFLVVNVDKSHAYVSEGDFLAASLHISYSELSSLMKQSMIFFWCNTAVDNNEACSELRGVLKRIITEQYRNQEHNAVYLNSLYYELLNLLTTDFLLNQKDSHYSEEAHRFDVRKQEIADYVRLNFDKQISLEDLSKQLFLSYAYLSKYIKRNFGMGFAEYLNTVRLNFAVSQLLHSDQSVVRIAMESGFASSAALNKAFREKYGMTPTEYRKKWTTHTESQENRGDDETALQDQLSRHFAGVRQEERRDKRLPTEEVYLGSSAKRVLKMNWNKLINIGTALDLLQSDIQNHILFLKKELGFEYVRFWDIYNPALLLSSGEGSYNFDRLDRVLDFLVNNGLKPYIELQNKPKVVIRNHTENVLCEPNNGADIDDSAFMEKLLRRLIVHLVNRYNADELETWYFELWDAEPEAVILQPALAEVLMSTQQYLEQFELVADVLREYVPGIRLGGGGFSMRYGRELFRRMLSEWMQSRQLPDFLSVYGYPYTSHTIGKEQNQSRNSALLRDMMSFARATMEELSFPTRELHMTEWSFSVSSRNVLNDSCMKGAYMVRTLIDSVDLVDLSGYWLGSDLFATSYDSHKLLCGSGGLISKDGIRKPAFHAIEFMNHLGKYVRKRDEHYIITDNGSGNWRIVCHNLKNLSHQYTQFTEDEIRISEQNSLFTDLKKHRIHFDLPGKKGGKYLLRIHSLNQRHGSLQDEWMAMSAPNELSREDLRYIGRVTVPHMVLQSVVAENGRIVFDITMEPNEIDYIHVTYQYS